MRKHGRLDANHQAIVEALTKMGAAVQSLADIGNGCPDLLVGYKNQTFLFEVKDGQKPQSRQRLTPAQSKWIGAWKGDEVMIVYSAIGAKKLLEDLTGDPPW